MPHSSGYVLRTRPYSDTRLLVDLFTKDAGRITCMARPAKLRGKVPKGHLQAFRVLRLNWQGQRDLSNLLQTEESHRHRIPATRLVHGLYLNELLLRLMPLSLPQQAAYHLYQQTLQLLEESAEPMLVVMQFELALLEQLGYHLSLWEDDQSAASIIPERSYHYFPDKGVWPIEEGAIRQQSIMISGQLLIALRDSVSMTLADCHALRHFLDSLWKQLIHKPLNSRQLLRFS